MRIASEGEMRRPLVSLAIALLSLSLSAQPAPAAPGDDQARATFILLLSKYVTWPEGAFASATAPIVVAVIGNPGLADQLSKLARGQVIEGRGFEILAAADAASASGAHIVFVSSPEEAQALASAKPVRVSEKPAKLADTDIAIRMEQGRIAFAVNRGDVQKRGLKLSSKLMRLASSFE
jgi:hypothetical protein